MSDRTSRISSRIRDLVHELSGYPVDELSEEATFLELGFDSLFLTQLATAFQNEFQVPVTFRQLFDEFPSIGALARRFDAELPAGVFEAEPPPSPEPEGATANTTGDEPSAGGDQARGGDQVPLPDLSGLPTPDFTGLENGASALTEVLAQQLDLMSRQLALLSGTRGASAPMGERGKEPSTEAAGTTPASPEPPRETSDQPGAEGTGPSLPEGFGPNLQREAGDGLSPAQRKHLDRLIERYTARTQRSKEQTQKYRPWHADPRTAAGFNSLWKEMVYPIWVERSAGSRLWDIDGNEYIDILNGFGPNFLGHSPPFLTEALKAQLDRGVEVGPQTPLAGETAQLFCELTGMDRVSFVNTGSEAVQAAIRLSRTVTGRDKIVVFRKDYHGNFDEVLIRGITVKGQPSSMPLAPGIPRRAVQDVVALEYGSDEALSWIRSNATTLAAVLVEPIQSRRPELQPQEFLHELRRITEEAGTVLVFDEVITGLRTGLGGAQAMFDVDADLATYGKVLGGGMPIGAVAGKARFMDTFDGGQWQYGDASFPEAGVTFFAGTFVRHPMAMAGANATLKYLRSVGPTFWEQIHRRTSRLTGSLNELFASRGIDIEVPHCCSQMFIRVNDRNPLANLLFYHVRERGVHVLEGFPSYMTASHSDEDVDAIIRSFEESVDEMQEGEIFPRGATGGASTAAAQGPQEFPLTAAQRDVWLASELSEEVSCAFNESDTVILRGELNQDALTRAVSHVLGRHQAFRLRFSKTGESQVDSMADPPGLQVVDLREVEAGGREEAAEQVLREQAESPFDLSSGPVVRPLLLRLSDQLHLLVLYSHHIVFDGWSAEVVMREIAESYSVFLGGGHPELSEALSFSGYEEAQREFQAGPEGGSALEFWRSTLAEPPGRLELPTDRPRPAERTFRGSTVHKGLMPGLSARLATSARELRLTPHSIVFSAFQVLLSRLAGQEEFVVGVPAAGQAAVGMENLVGYCVNLMPVRCSVPEGTPFDEFARQVWSRVLDSFENQRADFGELLRDLPLDRDPSRLPLVEVVFNYSGYLRELGFQGLDAEARENKRAAVLHDMFLNIVESVDGLVVDWDYNTDLFDEETIRQWIGHLEVILDAVCEDPRLPVDEIPLLSREEQANLMSGLAGS